MKTTPEYLLTELPETKTIFDYIDDVIVPLIEEDDFVEIRSLVDKEGIKNAAMSMHFGLGIWIRNTFGLWSITRENTRLYGKQLSSYSHATCADDLSSLIIKYILSKHFEEII